MLCANHCNIPINFFDIIIINMALLNTGINFGASSRLPYDRCAYEDKLSESVSPLLYKLNPNQSNSCNACLSVFGPRGGHNSVGDSTANSINMIAPSQAAVDVESILSNRNVIASRCKDGKVNDIDVNKFRLQHAGICNNFLDPVATHLTNPPQNYRSMAINRFYDLPKNPQKNIFYDWAVNTQLEARDNYRERIPRLATYDPSLPTELKGRTSIMSCYGGVSCPNIVPTEVKMYGQ